MENQKSEEKEDSDILDVTSNQRQFYNFSPRSSYKKEKNTKANSKLSKMR